MKNIRKQAEEMGHEVVGVLKRMPNDKKASVYVDSEGTVYWVDRLGCLMTIAGESWCI